MAYEIYNQLLGRAGERQRLDSVSGLAVMENNDMQNAAIMPAMSGPIEWLRFMEGIEQISE